MQKAIFFTKENSFGKSSPGFRIVQAEISAFCTTKTFRFEMITKYIFCLLQKRYQWWYIIAKTKKKRY